jgi:hypothetical protein
MKLRAPLAFSCALAIAAAGCATLDEPFAEKGTGEARTFDAPVAQVWKVLPGVVATSGFSVVRPEPEKGYLLAQRHDWPVPRGDRIAIFVEPAGPNRARVEMVTRFSADTILASQWWPEIFRKLRDALREPR